MTDDDETRQLIREWLAAILREREWTIEKLAVESGVSAPTLSRAMNLRGKHTMSLTSAVAIATATGFGLPVALAHQGAHLRDDVVPIAPKDADKSLPARVIERDVASRVLDLLGYMPGDHLRIDQAAVPRDHDVVVANTRDVETGRPRLILRQLDGQFLLTRSTDPDLQLTPVLVSSEGPRIAGVVVRCARQRGHK